VRRRSEDARCITGSTRHDWLVSGCNGERCVSSRRVRLRMSISTDAAFNGMRVIGMELTCCELLASDEFEHFF